MNYPLSHVNTQKTNEMKWTKQRRKTRIVADVEFFILFLLSPEKLEVNRL